jgi:DDE family transposase
VRILLRADSGFAREELMAWCEANEVDFLFGLAKNDRLIAKIATELAAAEARSQRTGNPARYFKDFRWKTRRSWSRKRRVVAKAEFTCGEANLRFVVTSLKRSECKARYLYEKVYCARGDMENRIKECQLDLYADRTSTATMRANQLRLWFASMAYVLLCATPAHTFRQGELRHHPPQTVEDRRARSDKRPPHKDRDGVRLSCSCYLGRCGPPSQCRGQSARLACLTRGAATRIKRGTTPRPTERPISADHSQP